MNLALSSAWVMTREFEVIMLWHRRLIRLFRPLIRIPHSLVRLDFIVVGLVVSR